MHTEHTYWRIGRRRIGTKPISRVKIFSKFKCARRENTHTAKRQKNSGLRFVCDSCGGSFITRHGYVQLTSIIHQQFIVELHSNRQRRQEWGGGGDGGTDGWILFGIHLALAQRTRDKYQKSLICKFMM